MKLTVNTIITRYFSISNIIFCDSFWTTEVSFLLKIVQYAATSFSVCGEFATATMVFLFSGSLSFRMWMDEYVMDEPWTMQHFPFKKVTVPFSGGSGQELASSGAHRTAVKESQNFFQHTVPRSPHCLLRLRTCPRTRIQPPVRLPPWVRASEEADAGRRSEEIKSLERKKT